MRIKEIFVIGLFGTFNHTIPLNQEERVTIIHSPNGFGKTAILRLVKAILSGNFTELDNIAFKKVNIKFDGENQIIVKKDKSDIEWNYLKNNEVLYPLERQNLVESIHNTAYFISIERTRNQHINQLLVKIEETNKSYVKLSQNLEATYPIRLIEKKTALKLDFLKAELKRIEEEQSELVEIGLFDSQNLSDTSFVEKVNDSNKIALSLYIEDMSRKLAVYENLLAKVKIFTDVINSRFLYKKMFVSKNRGIYFKDDNGIELEFNQLSSGEQHELVLFYELLFNVQENTLVLIDEPELSLHVSWQVQFLKDLIRVAKNAKFDVLLATHSPQIINDRWDLTVELKGKEAPQASKNGNKAVTV